VGARALLGRSAGEVEKNCADDQEEEEDGIDLEGKIKTRVDEAAGQGQPGQNDEASSAMNPRWKEPTREDDEKGGSNQ